MKDRKTKTEAQLAHHKKGARKRKGIDHRMVHQMIAKCAKELAGTWYENAAHDNQFYAYYPSQQFFIDYEWRRFILIAKKTLTDLMNSPNTPEAYRQDIYHALILDATLPYSTQELQLRPN